jgi:hypothetical protein
MLTAGLLSACSLPLPVGVHTPSNIATQRQQAGLQVLPQGPTAGQSQTAVVAGFIAAQASPAGDYAIARAFLTGDAASSWSPSTGLRVFAPDTEQLQLRSTQQERSVQVRLTALGNVDNGGHFVRDQRTANDFYGVTKTADGWRISSIPKGIGLQLSLVDLLRTFAVRSVYYLAPEQPGTKQRHLVPDRVFVRRPPGVDSVSTLVQRAFASPSAALEGSVDPVLSGVTPESVRRARDGIVTVQLSQEANALGADDLRNLSARLVWTLRADPLFAGLRLSTDRGVLHPPGAGDVQPATSWAAYDPEALSEAPTYYFVSRKRLRAAGSRLLTSPFTQAAPGGVAVDSVAVSPRGDRIATLHAVGRQVEVDLGSLTSAEVSVSLQRPGLSSPTWGSGEIGLWMLQSSDRVVRTDPAGTGLHAVSIQGRPAGDLRSLALSRDGTRAALVIDHGVYVAKVVWQGGVASLASPTLVLESHGRPRQVAWSSATELVVLQPDQGAAAVVRIAVDGSTKAQVLIGSLSPTAVAAAGANLIVASQDGALYSIGQGITKEQARGTAPTFPG